MSNQALLNFEFFAVISLCFCCMFCCCSYS